MGALPDRAAPVGPPRRDPAGAPPLQAVPRAAPDAPPTRPPEPGPERQQDPPEAAPTPREEEDESPPPSEPGEEELPPLWWERLRPPQVWDCPAPTLREEIERARQGDHLPETGPWRRAEQLRTWVSALLNAALLLLVHINRSAPRQAVAALFVALVLLIL